MEPKSRVAADMQSLGRVEARFAATEAERQALDAVSAVLEAEDIPSRVEGFVGHASPLWVLGVHGGCILIAAVLGIAYPKLGALGCLLTLISLVGEGTGRLGMLRWWMLRQPSYNLVVPPLPVEEPRGSVVVVSPLDVPRVRLRRPRWPRRPVGAVFGFACALTCLMVLRMLAEPLGTPLLTVYVVSVLVMAGTAAMAFIARREPRGVQSEASGLASTIEVLRRLRADPPTGVQVWTVFTGCGHAHQDGVEAFLRLRGHNLPAPLFVLALVEPGRPPLQATVSEGPLWPQRHLPTGPALVERLAWAGVHLPAVDRPEPTEARAATNLGFRALALTGGRGAPDPAAAARAASVAETLLRWFAEDLARSAEKRPLTPDLETEPVHGDAGPRV